MIGAEREVRAAVTLSRLMRLASGICSGRVAMCVVASVMAAVVRYWPPQCAAAMQLDVAKAARAKAAAAQSVALPPSPTEPSSSS